MIGERVAENGERRDRREKREKREKREMRGIEGLARSRYDPVKRGPITDSWSVVESTLSGALCLVLVGISGTTTGPSAVSLII